MLSLVCPVFVALLESRLMQSCSHCLVLSSWCGRWISIFSFAHLRWGFPSQPVTGLSYYSFFVILSCQCILNICLRHLLWKILILFSSFLSIFHVSQPYIKTGFTSVLYSLTLQTFTCVQNKIWNFLEYSLKFKGLRWENLNCKVVAIGEFQTSYYGFFLLPWLHVWCLVTLILLMKFYKSNFIGLNHIW